MKKLSIFLLVLLILTACENKQARIDELQAENDSLRGYSSEKELLLGNTIESFNRIQENLNEIKEKENIIAVNSEDSELADTARIMSDIQAIYDLMQENKATIKRLQNQLYYTNSKLKKSDSKIIELEKMITMLQEQINQKDKEIEALKQNLEDKNFHIQILTAQVDSISTEDSKKSMKLQEQDKKLNTVFIIYGTRDKLIEKNIIKKEGGFVGIGKTYTLANNLNHEYFAKADKRKVSSIPLKCKKAELITSHPENTYKFIGSEKSIDSLSITNTVQFWKNSRYLVVMTE